MPLWPHQQRAVDHLAPMIRGERRRIVAAAPTGAGKSLVMRRLAIESPSTAIYVHRRMLLDQVAEGLRKDGIRFGIVASGNEEYIDIDAPVQLCMVQTVAAKMKSRAYRPPEVRLVLDDECHADTGERKSEILDAHYDDGAVLMGWSATPVDVGHLYDELFVFATNSELRGCGAHLPADTYAPSEIELEHLRADPDDLLGKQFASEDYRRAIFGDVKQHWLNLNPDLTPSILFAPGVKESIWFAQHFDANGFAAAHISGESIWVDGEEHPSTPELREQVKTRVADGSIKIVCNRFVLREGVDIPELQHLIFAAPFDSLKGYIQAGGRALRAHPSHNRVTIQDHGGNFHRHGSLNADREWDIEKTDKELVRERIEKMVKSKSEGEQDIEPIVCPKCNKCRASGPVCPSCGYKSTTRSRKVLQANGELKPVYGDRYVPRKVSQDPADVKMWKSCYYRAKNSKSGQTFSQAEALFKRETGRWPDPAWPLMPMDSADRHLKVRDVPYEKLVKGEKKPEPQGSLIGGTR